MNDRDFKCEYRDSGDKIFYDEPTINAMRGAYLMSKYLSYREMCK